MSKRQKHGFIKKEDVVDIAIGLIILISLVATFYVILPSFLNTDVPVAYISSSSMQPTYYVGDLVIIKGVPGEKIKVGDVIVFQPIGYSELILHRVVAKKYENGKYYFLTKGDNPYTNTRIDHWGWVSEDRVHGVLIYRIPLIGFFFMFMSTIIGKILIIALAAIILFSDYFKSETVEKAKMINIERKKIVSLILLIIISASILIAFNNYIYIGEGKPDVKLVRVGSPYIEDNYKVYPIFLKISSYGLTGGTVREIYITPVNQYFNSTSPTVRWEITYPFVGSKVVCLAILLNISDDINDYNLFTSFKIEKMWSEPFFINKTIIV